jgi:hypothetical protein
MIYLDKTNQDSNVKSSQKKNDTKVERKELTSQEQIERTIEQLAKCPRVIKENDLKIFQRDKQQCEDFINYGVVNRMMQIKAQGKMMTLNEYCPTYLEYLNGVINYLATDLTKTSGMTDD